MKLWELLMMAAANQSATPSGPMFVGAAPATLVPEDATTVVNVGTSISGIQDGDYVLALWASDQRTYSALTFNTGAGLVGTPTELPNQSISSTAPGHGLSGWIYSSSAPSISINNPSGADATNGVLLLAAFRGVAAPGLAQVDSADGSTGNPNPPALSGIQAGSLILAVGFLDDDAVTFTAQSGYTLATQGFSQASNAASAVLSFAVASSDGLVNPASFSSSGSDNWNAYTIELRPA